MPPSEEQNDVPSGTGTPQTPAFTISSQSYGAVEAGECCRNKEEGDEKENASVQLWLFREQQLLLGCRGVCGCRVGGGRDVNGSGETDVI